jgi:exosortase/archaeosortase family protein
VDSYAPLDPVTGNGFRRPLREFTATDEISMGIIRPVLAVLILGAGVLLAMAQEVVRDVESALSASIVSHLGIEDAQNIGIAVVFHEGDRPVGYAVTLGCTAGLLALPLFLIAAGLLSVRRIPAWAAVVALVVGVVSVFLTNQVRLAAIGLAMNAWGAEPGYDRTHLLAGGIVSALGCVVAAAAFIHVLLLADRISEDRRGE